MEKEEITSEHLLAVCRLYKKYLGGSGIEDYIKNRWGELETLVREIRESGRTEIYKIGSRYDPHTKFAFRTDLRTKDVIPDLNLNFDPEDKHGPKYEEAQQSVALFLKEARRYLSSLKSA